MISHRHLPFLAIIPTVFVLNLWLSSESHAFLWKDIEVTPRVSAGERYDDNITYTKDDTKSDWVTNVLLGLGLRHEGKHNLLTMDANVAHQFFTKNTSFDNTSEALSMRFLQEFSKYDVLKITDSLSRSEEPRSFEDAFGRTSGRYYTLQNNVGVDYRHDFTQQVAGNLRFANALTNFSRKDLSDSVMNTMGTGVDYAFNSANIMSLNYDWNKRNFNPGPTATEQEITAVLRHFFTAQVYLDTQAGVDLIESYNNRDYTKPVFRVALTNDIDENTQTGIRFEKQYTTTAYTQDLFDIWRVSVNYLKALTSRVTGTFDAFYGEGKYATTNIKDQLIGATIGFNYDMTKDTRLNLSYSFSQDDSTNAGNSYTKNVIYLGVTINF